MKDLSNIDTSRRVVLKAGKEKPIVHKHHWIFSGAIASMPRYEDGEILPVYSHREELLGHAYFNRCSSLRGRMLSFGNDPIEMAVENAIERAFALRESFFDVSKTNAFRLINGEGDGLPGLIVDRYGDFLVVQIGTQGMEKMKKRLIELLVQKGNWKGIYEKSKLPSRREEGLHDQEGWLWGNPQETVSFIENGLHWQTHLPSAQKTGFFLDQRAMREKVEALSFSKRVLNCFAYTGGFSLYALRSGAKEVTSVDISPAAVKQMQEHTKLNGFEAQRHHCYEADVFNFLRERKLDYELVILDPPAFTKRKEEITAACRGYKEINRLALLGMPPRSVLITCSCSYHVDANLFQMVDFQAAHDAGRNVRIIGRHSQAIDHPINLYHPEGEYLKSLMLYVD